MEHSARSLQGWASDLKAESDRFSAMLGEELDGDASMWLRTYCEAAQSAVEA